MKYPARIKKDLPPHLSRKRDGDCPQHRAFVRQQPCLFECAACAGQMHAHHVRTAANSGTGIKPHDRFCVPLCAYHHDSIHRGLNAAPVEWLLYEADKIAKRSPALRRLTSPNGS